MGPVPAITRAFVLMLAFLVVGGVAMYFGFRRIGVLLGALGVLLFIVRTFHASRIARARERARLAHSMESYQS